MEWFKFYIAVTLISCCVFVAVNADDVSSAFENAGLVPSVIREAPTSELKVTWDNATAELGNKICPLKTIRPPSIDFQTSQGKNYTIVYIDPDVPSRAAPVLRSALLYLLVNVNGTNFNTGFSLAPFMPPTPSPGSGSHRIVIIAYVQSSYIEVYNKTLVVKCAQRYKFDVPQFVDDYDLEAVAGNFFTVEVPANYDGKCNKISAKDREL